MYELKQLVFILGIISPVAFAQPHLHGQGSLFIAQDDNHWQLQFTLPTSDIFGFEHMPMSQKQKNQVRSKITQLENVGKLVDIPEGCQLGNYKVDIPSDFQAKRTDKFSHHDGQKQHKHQHQEQHTKHSDVNIVLTLRCDKAISRLELHVFKTFSSLATLDVLWTLNKGQGQIAVSAANPKVIF